MAVVIALLTCFVVIPLGALAVDIGMQRVARSDMQSVADVVALDMARLMQTGGTPTTALATASAARTAGSVGSTPTVAVYLGYIAPTATFVSNQALGCGGSGSAYNSYFQPVSAGTANAVLVTATTGVHFSIHGGSGGACRSSIAQAGSG
ncbi:MAG: pilus assembly protein TadG-related protein, partial [Marmoricola sp.]